MKQYVILTDRPVRQDQSFKTEDGMWAVCSLPAENERDALKLCEGFVFCPLELHGNTKAVEGEFVWRNGRVVGLKLV